MANLMIVKQNKEPTSEDFFAAARVLSGTGYKLYTYMLFNCENYKPDIVAKVLNISNKSVYLAFKELWEKGFLENVNPSKYNFFVQSEEKT